ncbi:MAG: oxygen-independent coproporphyrinogen III oxidase [Paracoccaceae bacterium]
MASSTNISSTSHREQTARCLIGQSLQFSADNISLAILICIKELSQWTLVILPMENFDLLQRHGLFDAKVPRYTSYPPANHFQHDVGHLHQLDWLNAVDENETLSVYVHIPFCKRLCWFCACRTQGTTTLRPVDAYIEVVKSELRTVRQSLPESVKMGRLHLGGGTPTILSVKTMSGLLEEIFGTFATPDEFEFSVEIDPTEAAPDLLSALIGFGMNRASIGVQDFAPNVQKAIGRTQSLEQTKMVISTLRDNGISAINLDLLYGLPNQTEASFRQTLDHVIDMAPDRLAIYGYAHVPWMSKRQVLIKSEELPNTRQRSELANIAQTTLCHAGYRPIGIDHFAKPTDKLHIAHQNGQVRRNFQGYTDDQSQTLVGLGASAISRFKGGYIQNAVATSAYQERIATSGRAGHKGYEMTDKDTLVAAMIEALMCKFQYPTRDLERMFPFEADVIRQTSINLMKRYPDVFQLGPSGLTMRTQAYPLVRIIANEIDMFTSSETAHSAAV